MSDFEERRNTARNLRAIIELSGGTISEFAAEQMNLWVNGYISVEEMRRRVLENAGVK